MKRDNSLEWLRVASALGIVWFHSGVSGAYWGYAGLIIFLIMSIMFEAGPNVGRSVSIPQLGKRLLVPWAFWWIIYAALNLVRGHSVVDLTHGAFAGVLAGSSIHLWYLPFIFAVLVAFGSVKEHLPVRLMAVGAAVVTVALVVAIPIWKPASPVVGAPMAQWMHAAVPLLIGILTGCAMREGWLGFLAGAVATVLVWACFQAFPDVAIIYLLGFAMVGGVLALPLHIRLRAPDAELIFRSMLGVYLVHPLALLVLRPMFEAVELALPMVAYGVSAIAVLVAQWAAPYPSSLVLGTRMPTDQSKRLVRSRSSVEHIP